MQKIEDEDEDENEDEDEKKGALDKYRQRQGRPIYSKFPVMGASLPRGFGIPL